MNPQVFPAPAKLNLFLHVTGQRSDGYHLLQTVFRFIDYGDTLGFTPRADGQIVLTHPLPGVPPEKDLCYRAAHLLQTATGTTQGVDITLEKRLPLGGGLGGGSSDAATTLLALNQLWGTGLSRSALMELGLQLGADVPVFVLGENAWAEGVGEKLVPIALPPAWYVVLIPPLSVETAEVFAAPELTRNTLPVTMSAFSAGQVRNDLEPVVSARYPAVAQHLKWLKQYGDARMTGSGACVFAAFNTEREARDVLAGKPVEIEGFVARGLDRHPLHDL
ncbi:MAG: 4-(cytidine 5'-diphospho)-2-C-methyl-D-erythritol kinase [Betaproteobacteria bacterium RBG_16_58_11]|nr:MAG: 4-(cytidine 5'-diphospho)-2-C-methyl-D-erythritol kinase [Betaproteobacteria bacterium RBG_16_58_11]